MISDTPSCTLLCAWYNNNILNGDCVIYANLVYTSLRQQRNNIRFLHMGLPHIIITIID